MTLESSRYLHAAGCTSTRVSHQGTRRAGPSAAQISHFEFFVPLVASSEGRKAGQTLRIAETHDLHCMIAEMQSSSNLLIVPHLAAIT